MNVLSLFDGMSGGRIALERAGIPVTNYFASEIDKHAIKVSKANWPDIKYIGSVVYVDISYDAATDTSRIYNWLTGEDFTFKGRIDLIIGGSPCQGFSFAGKQLNFNDPRSKLFFEFVRLKKQTGATWFFLENVKMAKASEEVISEYMGVQPIRLNSALVSAQTRKRLYWTNIPYFGPPEDRGIFLKDILLTDIDPKYILSQEAVDYMCREVKGGRNHWDFHHHHDSANEKSSCITAAISKGVPYNVLIDRNPTLRVREATKIGYCEVKPGECFDNTLPSSKTRRGRYMGDKANCLTATNFQYYQYLGKVASTFERMTAREFGININESGDFRPHKLDGRKSGISEIGTLRNENNKGLTLISSHVPVVYTENPFLIRRLTEIECERLQNVPDDYTIEASGTQRYRMLGNGWECNTITYLFKPLQIADIL